MNISLDVFPHLPICLFVATLPVDTVQIYIYTIVLRWCCIAPLAMIRDVAPRVRPNARRPSKQQAKGWTNERTRESRIERAWGNVVTTILLPVLTVSTIRAQFTRHNGRTNIREIDDRAAETTAGNSRWRERARSYGQQARLGVCLSGRATGELVETRERMSHAILLAAVTLYD